MQRDDEGDFYDASTDDGSATVRIRDVPPGVQSIGLTYDPLNLPEIPLFPDPDEAVISSADDVASAAQVLLADQNGTKFEATIELILAPWTSQTRSFCSGWGRRRTAA